MDELKVNKCPDRIYLQACDECYKEGEEITWCADPIDHAKMCNGDGHEIAYNEETDECAEYPPDLVYIREDIYLDLLKRVREAVEENDKDNAAARMFITWGGARSVFMSHVPELEKE